MKEHNILSKEPNQERVASLTKEELLQLSDEELTELLLQKKETLYKDEVLLAQIEQKTLHQKKTLTDLKVKNHEKTRLINWLTHQVCGGKMGERTYRYNCKTAAEQAKPFDYQKPLQTPFEPPLPETTLLQYENVLRETGKPPVKIKADHLKFNKNVPRIAPKNSTTPNEEKSYRLAQSFDSYYLKETNSAQPSSFVLPDSFADNSFLAGMIIERCQNHQPLRLQHKNLLRTGIKISRSTMYHLFSRTAKILEPIYLAVCSSVLQGTTFQVDESPTSIRAKIGKQYLWTFLGDQQELFFTYSPTPESEFLNPYQKNYADSFSYQDQAGYNAYQEKLIENNSKNQLANSWEHVRNRFTEAIDIDPKLCKLVLNQITQLYQLEKEIKKAPQQTLEIRRQRSKPIVDEILERLFYQKATRTDLQKNPLSQALDFCLKHRKELQRFLEDPDLTIDHQFETQTPYRIEPNKKSWLFFTKEDGVRDLTILYTLFYSSLLAGLDPHHYFNGLLQQAAHAKIDQIHTLTPKNWKQIHDPS